MLAITVIGIGCFDLCGVTDTVIGDIDGLYHPGSFNDRLLFGLKGTMSEAELHVLRARLDGGIRNKAQRGELRSGLPVGFVWGDGDGDVLLDRDEAVRGAIESIFDRFDELGSARQVWLWMRREGVQFSLRRLQGEMQWVTPTYHQIHSVLESPVMRAHTRSGRPAASATSTSTATRASGCVGSPGRMGGVDLGAPPRLHRQGHVREQPRADRRNTRPRAHEPGGAVREGQALLQGIAVCGRCGRKLNVHYHGRRGHKSPAYHCPGSELVEGRGRGACASAARRSTRRSPARCWQRSPPPA